MSDPLSQWESQLAADDVLKTSNSHPVCEKCRAQIVGEAVEIRKFYPRNGETVYPDLPSRWYHLECWKANDE